MMKIIKKIRLRVYIRTYNFLYHQISKLASKLNDNIHPKHRIMKYHKYFIDNIKQDSGVLDIGCGNGYLTYEISEKAQRVIAIDINRKHLDFAKKHFNRENIEYINADIMNYKIQEIYDYVILSNVLEHIKDRKALLLKIKPLGKCFLIRVPLITRSWLPLYEKELGVEYRLDGTHYIEYTFKSFSHEIESVGLKIYSYIINFGEIWARVEPFV